MRCDRCKRRSSRTNLVESHAYPPLRVDAPRPPRIAEEHYQCHWAGVRARTLAEVALCGGCRIAGWQPNVVLTGVHEDMIGSWCLEGFVLPSYRTEHAIPVEMLFVLDGEPERSLRSITGDFLAMLGDDIDPLGRELAWTDYHGFMKARLPEDRVDLTAIRYGQRASDVQVEVVTVNRDLAAEIHAHAHSRAFNVVLGPTEGFDEARGAQVFLKDRWLDIQSGDRIEFPQGVKHGFTVRPGGILHFLSVQSPPIVGRHGQDDYIPAAA